MGILRTVLLAGSVLVLLVLLPAFPQAEAGATWGGIANPDFPNTCFVKEKGIRVKLGTTQLPGCAQATCTKTSEYGMRLRYSFCRPKPPPPNCRIERDLSQPFPGCCGYIYCNYGSGIL